VVIGVLAFQTSNTSLFKGQIELQEEAEIGDNNLVDQFLKPDLSASLQVIPPDSPEGDISVNVTIENLGPGAIDGQTPFRYAISLGSGQGDFIEIFSNIDSYTYMSPGDSFNFIYPISRSIYQYENQGTIRAMIDTENNVKEENEDNNEVSSQFFL